MTSETQDTKTRHSGSLTRATLIIAVFTLLSRIMGLVRDTVLANTFGFGKVLDAYYAAFRIPDFLFNLFILGTLSAAFLPIFNRELIRSKERAEKLTSTVFGVTVTCIGILSLVLLLYAPFLVHRFAAPGLKGEQLDLAIQLTRVMILSPILFSAGAIASVLLQSYKRFLPTAIAPIFYNLGIILGAVVFYRIFGAMGLALGVLLGAAMHTAVQFWSLRTLPIKLGFSLDVRSPLVKDVWKTYLPRLLYFDNTQISLLVASIVGSFLASGSISIFNQANNLQAVPLGIFALSFVVAVFPGLSKSWADNNFTYFRKLISQTTVQILFFVLPFSALIFILRAQIVRMYLTFGHQHSWQEVSLLATTLGLLSLSIFAQSLSPLFSRAFYASYNTVLPLVINVTTSVVNIILAIWFSHRWGLPGLAAATAIANILDFVLLGFFLRTRVGKLYDYASLDSILKILICTSLAATTTYATLYAVSPVINTSAALGLFIQAACAVFVGTGVYLIMGLLLNLAETRAFVRTIRNWFGKLARPLTSLLMPWWDQ